ncbi:hypothetical protein [Luteolibacter sp. LG18]|uniref:hypothetical protein n=1 Tax=Luteolibacter sp. LG18 TaxID=2819286 RepID=UPI002B31FBEA|nr:hypothetical protein llg_14550 [Luteolibacter sp. LG18]
MVLSSRASVLLATLLVAGLGIWWVMGKPQAAGEPTRPDGPRPPTPQTEPSKSPATGRARPAKTGKVEAIDEALLAKMRAPESYEHVFVRKLLTPFDPEELVRYAEQPDLNPSVFAGLLGRAVAEKNPRFRYLLERKDLRDNEELSPFLLAYDYAVNGNRAALDELLQRHRDGTKNWGTWEITALSYVDEWDQTREALGSRLLSGDGASGDERYGFWLTRRYLFPANPAFPKDYQAFQADLLELQRQAPPRPAPVVEE